MIMRRLLYILLSLLILSGCFRDLGNYDYSEVNEAVISDRGFEEIYDVRRKSDVLKITPEITFTLDKDGRGNYSYEWVAVGQNFYRGERFVIGTERNLEYPVELQAEEYILYLKVKDLDTDMVYSRSVGLNVRSTNTMGWILAGEDHNGKGQADMISLSSTILYLKDALDMREGLQMGPITLAWIDNDEWTSEDRLYAASPAGSYKFGREDFAATPFAGLKYSFAFPSDSEPYVMTDNQKVSDKRHVVIVDGKAYIVSSDGGMIGNTFCVYDDVHDFSVADKMICNHTDIQGIRTFIFYDKDNHKFCYIAGLTVKGMNTLGDAEGDEWSWNTSNDFAGGLTLKTTVNSFFSNGQALALMESASGEDWIYGLTAPRTGAPVKDMRYKVDKSVAVGWDDAVGYMLTTNHGFLVYASGSAIYGYNFRKNPQECVLLHQFDAPVTCLKADYETSEKYSDIFYAATYDDSRERSGKVVKFQVVDHPDKMEVEQKTVYDEGFLKVYSMCYKAF